MIPSAGVRPLSPASIPQGVKIGGSRGVPSKIRSIPVTTMTTPKRTGLVCPVCRQPVAVISKDRARNRRRGQVSGARRAAIARKRGEEYVDRSNETVQETSLLVGALCANLFVIKLFGIITLL